MRLRARRYGRWDWILPMAPVMALVMFYRFMRGLPAFLNVVTWRLKRAWFYRMSRAITKQVIGAFGLKI